MTLSNGKKSPLFTAPSAASPSDVKTIQLGNSSLVRKVQVGRSNNYIVQLIFKNQNGDEIGRIETFSNSINKGDEYTLNDGEEIKVQFNLRGREWNGPQGIKYFNTLEAWRIEKVSGGNSSAPSSQNSNQATNNTINTSSAPVFTGNVGDNDDLPF